MAVSVEPTLRDLEAESLVGLSDAELARVDPIVANLLVARGVPALRDLDIGRYTRTADAWVSQCARWMAGMEGLFHEDPAEWKHDLALFRLGLLYQYMDQTIGIRYREDQRNVRSVVYTDPNDLFVNGVMDSRQGTCGNMAALYFGLAWRYGWPVTLATAGYHLLVQYFDGQVRHNVEASTIGEGGFSAPTDDFYVTKHGVSEEFVVQGLELRPLRPREVLGVFFGLRLRYFRDVNRPAEAERDLRLAKSLAPDCWWLGEEEWKLAAFYAGGRITLIGTAWTVSCTGHVEVPKGRITIKAPSYLPGVSVEEWR
jgi:hypothetical protein